ncbi:Gfo/Idh/MocA family oxidoreductase [Deltaproteobacteria bacterium OttesenSCG-928-K17]|nr:Gfo/Idh/MocA family oxidoreductase [Deltaproteobacteria bacterium OttesenSCG-928-K17]
MNVGIIGCGLIGHKRAASLGRGLLAACADVNAERAEALSRAGAGCRAYVDWRELLKHPGLDLVVISTLHDSLAEISIAALEAGLDVLVEKPAGRNLSEIKAVAEAARRTGRLVRVGFNHRYHRSVLKARELFEAPATGEPMFIRARYGHGGRVGYDREWRADPRLSGGGELIDQGPHLIDLARWFLGDFTSVSGFAHTYYWDMPVDDNAFMTLRTAAGQTAFMQVSCTEWKNLFSMEIYCRRAKIELSGLGGSYGPEKVTLYQMSPEMGPPETFSWEYPMADNSWAVELEEFYEDIRLRRAPAAGLAEALAVHEVIEKIYSHKEKS